MKSLKYNLTAKIDRGTPEEPVWEETMGAAVTMGYSEANLKIAKQEAWQGQVVIEDDGQPEPEPVQTPEERIAELEEALELLLSGVTE